MEQMTLLTVGGCVYSLANVLQLDSKHGCANCQVLGLGCGELCVRYGAPMVLLWSLLYPRAKLVSVGNY